MSKRKSSDLYFQDPTDGLRVAKVGNWSAEKHLRLRKYVDISRAARRKWSKEYGKETSYIDLYCGPGRARINETGEIIDGSAVVAAMEAAGKSVPFDSIYVADIDQENLSACEERLAQKNCQGIQAILGPASTTAVNVLEKIDRTSLHIALLDPFNIKSMPFEVIKTLARVKHMDMIIHISTMDLQRNLRLMMENGVLEAFAPSWSNVVDERERSDLVMGAVFRHWRSCLEALDYKVSDNVERISGAKNQPLYWLAFATRSDLAEKFWGQISDVSVQRGFSF